MKNILVPTDFSETAKRAADIAIAIAEKSGAEIHFFAPTNHTRAMDQAK